MCKAGGVTNFAKLGIVVTHINYGKAHVSVPGLYDSQPIMTCIFCGVELSLCQGHVGNQGDVTARR